MGKEYYRPSEENPYKVKNTPSGTQNKAQSKDSPIDFKTARICPACGKIIKISHNFCKFCGIDLSTIIPLGNSDRTLIELAKTALTDPNADVRRDAVDTIGDLGENDVLGILTYILINDIDALVRKEAADELGNKHNSISIDILTKTLKDRSPIVRKQAIEALKKIKKAAKSKESHENEIQKMEPREQREEFKKENEQEGNVVETPKPTESEQKLEPKNENEHNEEEDEHPLIEIDPQDDDYYRV
ncbi:MAG: HEAT repeat domain-containing protein [Candidatus Hermodarchaeota archaeon]